MGPYGRISHFVSFLKCSLIPTPGYLLARTAYDCMDSGGQERGNPLSHTDRSETCSLCRSRARSVAPTAPRLPGQEVAVAETLLTGKGTTAASPQLPLLLPSWWHLAPLPLSSHRIYSVSPSAGHLTGNQPEELCSSGAHLHAWALAREGSG